jgi:hypothetical protein
MALTGQLSDMSLAELIEFFCNQRKTGRLKIDYPRGHSVFFIKDGELVDAKVGALSGPEAVYFSLTLPNAAFDFSPDVQATRRTIDNSWTQVVLEGLRRLDEGHAPTEADAFGAWSPSEAELAQMFDQVEHLDAAGQQKSQLRKSGSREKAATPLSAEAAREESPREEPAREESSREPFSTMVESAGQGGSKKKLVLVAVAAAVVLACVVAAVPFMSGSTSKVSPASAASDKSLPAAPAQASPADAAPAQASGESTEVPAADATSSDAADAAATAARREALERERRERERRERREEAAKREDAAADTSSNAAANAAINAAAPKPAAPSGPKSVRVSVTYDEAGRVTQAAVAGTTPGAEAYGSTAIRIARGKRFPAGSAGSTVITIPVN